MYLYFFCIGIPEEVQDEEEEEEEEVDSRHK